MEYTSDSSINYILNKFNEEFYLKEFSFQYDLIELRCILYMFEKYIQTGKSSCTSTIYKSKNKKYKYFCYIIPLDICDSHVFMRYFTDDNIKKKIKMNISVFIEIDIKNFNKVRLKIFSIKDILESYRIPKKEFNLLCETITDDIENIIGSIKNKKMRNSGLIKFIGIKGDELVGYYKTKFFEIDAGNCAPLFKNNGKKVKIKYKFPEYIINAKFNNKTYYINLSDFYQAIINTIIQTIGKIKIEDDTNQTFYGNSNDLSIFHEKYDKTSREKIPPYIDEIIDNFLKLSPAKQNCLYRSCYSYLEAKRTIGPRSLFFSYQAIDNIVWYKEKIGEYPSGQRSNNINNLLNKYYNGYFSKNIDSEVIKWWDENRNKFAHNGIEENDLTNIIIERTYDTLYIKNIEHDVADFVYIIIISELNNSLNK